MTFSLTQVHLVARIDPSRTQDQAGSDVSTAAGYVPVELSQAITKFQLNLGSKQRSIFDEEYFSLSQQP